MQGDGPLPDVLSLRASDPPVPLEAMLERGKLITVDYAKELLGRTEPLAYHTFDTGTSVRFRVDEEEWNKSDFVMEEYHGTSPVPVYMSLATSPDGTESSEFQLSKDAVLEAAKNVPGMGHPFVFNAPDFILEDTLNHWFRSRLDKTLQLMTIGDKGQAIVRESIVPFSNLEILDRAIAAIDGRFPGLDVYVDSTKISHSLRQTFLQLVVPGLARVMDSNELDDRWWGGIQIANSQAGETQATVEGFLYRQRCTNGMIDRSPHASSWSRRGADGNSPELVYEWAQKSVDDVLGGLEDSFNQVEEMLGHSIEGAVAETALDVFETFRIPKKVRERVEEYLIESDQLNMYALMNAVTQSANTVETPREQQLLMRAGGAITEHAERCSSCLRLKV